MEKLIDSLKNKKEIYTFLKFACVGVINTVTDTLLFFWLCDIWGINEIVSNVISYMISATNSYFLNSAFVYKQKQFSVGKYFKFLTANITVLIISTVMIAFISRFTEIKTVAKLITVPITMIINFILQRFMVFKNNTPS